MVVGCARYGHIDGVVVIRVNTLLKGGVTAVYLILLQEKRNGQGKLMPRGGIDT
jgi:hypothetical protein